MKIAVISSMVISCPPPGYSGLEQLAYQMAEGLAGKGHDVTLYAPEGSRTEKAKLIMPSPQGQWGERGAYVNCRQTLIRHDGSDRRLDAYDAIVDHSWRKWAYMLKMEGKLKSPILGVFHSTLSHQHMQALPKVDKPCVVCLSEDQAEHFKSLYNYEPRVAYNGVDTEFYKQIPGIKRTDRFLFLARFSSIKGADLAIQACKEARVGLDLVGDDRLTGEPDYLKQIKDWCDGDQIRMVGPASRGECVYWFSRAHALLHPNMRFREPFGLAPVEALLCGCPVIAWAYGAMRETIPHGPTSFEWDAPGWLVKSLDEMVQAILHFKQNPPIEVQRKNIRQWATRFSIERFVDRYEELCQEAIRTGGW